MTRRLVFRRARLQNNGLNTRCITSRRGLQNAISMKNLSTKKVYKGFRVAVVQNCIKVEHLTSKLACDKAIKFVLLSKREKETK